MIQIILDYLQAKILVIALLDIEMKIIILYANNAIIHGYYNFINFLLILKSVNCDGGNFKNCTSCS